MTDYEKTSRFSTDPDFQVVTRQGVTIGTVVILPPPVRGPNDQGYIVPLKFQFRWDLVAKDMLGDPKLRGVVMRHNRIEDPFGGPRMGDRLLIPTQDQVDYYQNKT